MVVGVVFSDFFHIHTMLKVSGRLQNRVVYIVEIAPDKMLINDTTYDLYDLLSAHLKR